MMNNKGYYALVSNVVNLRRLKTDRNLSRYLSFLILNYERIY